MIYIATYIALLLIITFLAGQGKSEDDFLVAGRSNSALRILTSKFAGAIGVATFITYTGYAYEFGVGVFALLIGSVFGYSVFAFWAAPKINQLSAAHQFTSQGDLPGFMTDSTSARKITNWVTVLIQFFWVLLSLVGGAKVIAQFGLFSYPLALLLTGSIVLAYLLLSGLKAVIITDMIQAIIILIFLILIVNNLLQTPGSMEAIFELEVASIKPGQIVGLLLYGGLSVYGMADRYQLCFAAANKNAAKWGMASAIIPVVLVAFLLMLIGLNVLRETSGLESDLVFIHAMVHQLSASWYPILITLFFAGLMSSADTSVFAVSAHITANLETDNKVKTVRLVTVGLIVVSVVIALFWKNIVEITIVGAALRLVLAVPMIYVLLEKKNAGRYLASVLGGSVGLFAGLLAFGADPKLAITTLLGTLLGMVYRSRTGK